MYPMSSRVTVGLSALVVVTKKGKPRIRRLAAHVLSGTCRADSRSRASFSPNPQQELAGIPPRVRPICRSASSFPPRGAGHAQLVRRPISARRLPAHQGKIDAILRRRRIECRCASLYAATAVVSELPGAGETGTPLSRPLATGRRRAASRSFPRLVYLAHPRQARYVGRSKECSPATRTLGITTTRCSSSCAITSNGAHMRDNSGARAWWRGIREFMAEACQG